MGRVTAVVACLSVVAATAMGSAPTAATAEATDGPVLISGTGSAHGLGMAMDGVEGQARAGWTADRILSLFYRGSVPSKFGGTIRVGLSLGRTQTFTLPGGGTVSDAAPGQESTEKFPIPAGPNARVSVRNPGRGIDVRVSGAPEPTPDPDAKPADSRGSLATQTDPEPSPSIEGLTPPPGTIPTPEATPERTPEITPAPAAAGGPMTTRSSIWIVPRGNPALTDVDATGHPYRGTIEVRREGSSALRVINHVPIDTYVAGIAEEKGQSWPHEGLKVLAIAARSLGAAAMTWHDNNHGAGYDICPNENCQVYLGVDGEEPAMQRAVDATAGQIRTFRGRPILAMYHGNGGGITESYKRLTTLGTDPYPYLQSVRYPHASPSHWERAVTYREIASALAGAGSDVPLPLVRINVLERGDSPRVLEVGLVSDHDEQRDVSGSAFAKALRLRSTWFHIIAEGPEVLRAAAQIKARGDKPLAIGATGKAPGVPSSRSPSLLFAALLLLSMSLAIVALTSHRQAIVNGIKALRPRRLRTPEETSPES